MVNRNVFRNNPPGSKSADTRTRILSAALELFREEGFEATTVRQIAVRAGVATGAAYYYFDSKDAIVFAFYETASREMESLLEDVLAASRELAGRLRGIIEVKLTYFAPSRSLLSALASHTDPEKPLSPFSEQTRHIRESDIRFFERAIAGSGTKIPDDLKTRLPGLLWMLQMGMVLFWIYDRSPSQEKTRKLLGGSITFMVRLIRLSRLPLMQPLRRMLLDLVDTVAS